MRVLASEKSEEKEKGNCVLQCNNRVSDQQKALATAQTKPSVQFRPHFSGHWPLPLKDKGGRLGQPWHALRQDYCYLKSGEPVQATSSTIPTTTHRQTTNFSLVPQPPQTLPGKGRWRLKIAARVTVCTFLPLSFYQNQTAFPLADEGAIRRQDQRSKQETHSHSTILSPPLVAFHSTFPNEPSSVRVEAAKLSWKLKEEVSHCVYNCCLLKAHHLFFFFCFHLLWCCSCCCLSFHQTQRGGFGVGAKGTTPGVAIWHAFHSTRKSHHTDGAL